MKNLLELLFGSKKNQLNTTVQSSNIDELKSVEIETDDLTELLQKMLDYLKLAERNEEFFGTTTRFSFYYKPNIHVTLCTDTMSYNLSINEFNIKYFQLSKSSQNIFDRINHTLQSILFEKDKFNLSKIAKEIKALDENN